MSDLEFQEGGLPSGGEGGPSVAPLSSDVDQGFPFHAFPPGPFTAMAKAVSDALPVPRELSYILAVSVTGALAGRRVEAVNTWSGLSTRANLLWMIVAETGSGKSLAATPFRIPLQDLEQGVASEWRNRQSALQVERRRLESELRPRGGVAKNTVPSAEAAGRDARLIELDTLLAASQPKWIEGAPTPEALTVSMSTWDECGYLFDTEADQTMSIFEGRSRKTAPAFGQLCALFSGDSVLGSRIGRETKPLRKPCLSGFLAMQHGVADRVRWNEEARNRGFVARCIWVQTTEPPPIDTTRRMPEIPEGVSLSYAKACRELFLKFCAPSPEQQVVRIHFEDAAGHHLLRVSAEQRERLRNGAVDAELHVRRAELITRISLGLHLMRHGVDAGGHEISLETVLAAQSLYEWTLRPWVHDEEADREKEFNEALEKLRKALQDGGFPCAEEGVTARDIYRFLNWTSSKGNAFVQVLLQLGLLSEFPQAPGARTTRYDLWSLLRPS